MADRDFYKFRRSALTSAPPLFTVASDWFWGATPGGYTLTAQGAAYTYAPQSATLQHNRLLTAQGVAYSWQPQNAALARAYTLTAQGAAYVYTPQSVALSRNRLVSAQGVAYSWQSQSVTLLRNPTVVAQGATYSWRPQQATLSKTVRYTLTALGAQYTWAPQAAELRKAAASADGSNGLRRWLIQYYTDEQAKRDAHKVKQAPKRTRRSHAVEEEPEETFEPIDLRSFVRQSENFARQLQELSDATQRSYWLSQNALKLEDSVRRASLAAAEAQSALRQQQEDEELLAIMDFMR